MFYRLTNTFTLIDADLESIGDIKIRRKDLRTVDDTIIRKLESSSFNVAKFFVARVLYGKEI